MRSLQHDKVEEEKEKGKKNGKRSSCLQGIELLNGLDDRNRNEKQKNIHEDISNIGNLQRSEMMMKMRSEIEDNSQKNNNFQWIERRRRRRRRRS